MTADGPVARLSAAVRSVVPDAAEVHCDLPDPPTAWAPGDAVAYVRLGDGTFASTHHDAAVWAALARRESVAALTEIAAAPDLPGVRRSRDGGLSVVELDRGPVAARAVVAVLGLDVRRFFATDDLDVAADLAAVGVQLVSRTVDGRTTVICLAGDEEAIASAAMFVGWVGSMTVCEPPGA